MIGYDWRHRMTGRTMEQEFSKFHFHGPGWYEGEDTLLIVPVNSGDTDKDAEYDFYCWTGPNGRKLVMEEIAKLIVMDIFYLSNRFKVV